MTRMRNVLQRAAQGEPLSREDAHGLARPGPQLYDSLLAAAAARRDRAWGKRLTFSPKVFLPLTNLCRNRCDYCSFRRSARESGAWTMTPDQVRRWLDQGRAQGCCEALFCLGDKPERTFRSYREQLAGWGHGATVDYLEWGAREALQRGLLPHTNAGILSAPDMRRLKKVNVSLGLMLENISPRLCERGMPHHSAPDKWPARRVAMIRAAGELGIPFTTGILVGIGETPAERVDSLLAIAELHRAHGHVQEVIVQNFTTRPGIPMAGAVEPGDDEIAHAVALARLILDDEVGVQAPPNLNPARTELLVRAGINDFGGISPVTPDYINPRHPWPHLEQLHEDCARLGYDLRPRSPIYERFVKREGFVDTGLALAIQREHRRLQQVDHPGQLAAGRGRTRAALLPRAQGARP